MKIRITNCLLIQCLSCFFLAVASSPLWSSTKWSDPIQLAGTAIPQQQVGSGQTVVDDNGNALAIWSQKTAGLGTISIIASASLPFGATSWMPLPGFFPEISDPTTNASNPQIAVDASGNAIAIWQQEDSVSGFRVIRTATLAFGASVWSVPSTISTNPVSDATKPQISMNGSSTALAV